MNERIVATYWIETAHDLEWAAQALAGEQSSGTFVPVPGESPELKARAAARVETITELEPASEPSLPGAQGSRTQTAHARWRRAIVRISWPLANLGTSLPMLMSTVAGNLFELQQFSGVQLLDIELPDAFGVDCPGPQFGIEGTRRLAGVRDQPLIGTIIKPSVGLFPDDTARLVQTLCDAGIDFIKDDELQGDGPACPFDDRVRAVMAVINRHADRTGKKVMYAFNLSGGIDQMRYRHDLVLAQGGTCVMVNLIGVGLTGVEHLRRHAVLPIHGHRNGWGALSRSPALGFNYVAWQKFWRLAGVDHMHVNGLSNKFCESDDSVLASARACQQPMFEGKPCTVMPVFSSGQTVHQAVRTYAALGSTDLIYACGGGIMAHPDGVAAGVAGVRQAWEAAVKGVALETYGQSHTALATALKAFA